MSTTATQHESATTEPTDSKPGSTPIDVHPVVCLHERPPPSEWERVCHGLLYGAGAALGVGLVAGAAWLLTHREDA